MQQVQGIWAQGLDDVTCASINHKYRLIAFGRKKYVHSVQISSVQFTSFLFSSFDSQPINCDWFQFAGSGVYNRWLDWRPGTITHNRIECQRLSWITRCSARNEVDTRWLCCYGIVEQGWHFLMEYIRSSPDVLTRLGLRLERGFSTQEPIRYHVHGKHLRYFPQTVSFPLAWDSLSFNLRFVGLVYGRLSTVHAEAAENLRWRVNAGRHISQQCVGRYEFRGE